VRFTSSGMKSPSASSIAVTLPPESTTRSWVCMSNGNVTRAASSGGARGGRREAFRNEQAGNSRNRHASRTRPSARTGIGRSFRGGLRGNLSRMGLCRRLPSLNAIQPTQVDTTGDFDSPLVAGEFQLGQSLSRIDQHQLDLPHCIHSPVGAELGQRRAKHFLQLGGTRRPVRGGVLQERVKDVPERGRRPASTRAGRTPRSAAPPRDSCACRLLAPRPGVRYLWLTGPPHSNTRARRLRKAFQLLLADLSSSWARAAPVETINTPCPTWRPLHGAQRKGGIYRPCLRGGWMPWRAATCRAYSMPSSICWRECRCLGSLSTRRSVSANMANASSDCSGKRGKDCT